MLDSSVDWTVGAAVVIDVALTGEVPLTFVVRSHHRVVVADVGAAVVVVVLTIVDVVVDAVVSELDASSRLALVVVILEKILLAGGCFPLTSPTFVLCPLTTYLPPLPSCVSYTRLPVSNGVSPLDLTSTEMIVLTGLSSEVLTSTSVPLISLYT